MRTTLMRIALLAALQAACGGDSGPTQPTTNTPPPATNASADFTVSNTPCVAPSAGPVSCAFNATASGGTGPYSFEWTFTNPGNNQAAAVPDQGPRVSPTLPCGFSAGVVTFTVTVTLTARPMSGTAGTITRTQSITRAAGACGT
jgi:hypothetical protein